VRHVSKPSISGGTLASRVVQADRFFAENAVKNVRAMDTTVEFTWPITVIGGMNGSGKTTLLQACSSTYVKEVGGRYFKLGEWIRGALVGETPAIKDPAKISYVRSGTPR
jgi:ABC-type branched-subunit amino acid transport system ATPase component